MKKFRIKEVKDSRIDSSGNKASMFYPQVTNLLGFFRNIRCSEMKDETFKGGVLKYKSLSASQNSISLYRKAIGWKPSNEIKKKVEKQTKVVFHSVNW